MRIEDLPRRGPPRPRRRGTSPRRKRMEKKPATRVALLHIAIIAIPDCNDDDGVEKILKNPMTIF